MKEEKLIGKILRRSGTELKGWCKIETSDLPVQIECFVDDKSTGIYLANEARPMLSKKGFSSLNHGFSIPLNSLPNRIHKIEIRSVETGNSIPGSPTFINGSDYQPLIYFVHLPKTAGTSFRLMLNDCFAENQIFPNLNDIKKSDGLYPDLNEVYSLPKSRRNELALINGHYPLGIADRWINELKIITFFRHPVDRVISHLKHLKKNDKNCQELSLEDIYARHKGSLVNLQLRALKNREYKTANNIDFHSKKLSESKIKATLDRFTAFGLVEDFEKSIEWMSRALHLNFSKPILVNQSLKGIDVSDELKNQILLDCHLEQAMYELIKTEFYKRLELNN